MTTVRDIVTKALKLGKVTADPTADEAEDGLDAFQTMLDLWVANSMFGTLEDVYLTEDETALEGKRYYVPAGLTLTDATSEYETELGETRQPRDLALYEVLSGGSRSVKLYDRTAWVELTGLTLASDAPLASRGKDGLAACLATSAAFLASFNDADISPRVDMLARQFMGAISGKQGSTQDKIAPDYF